VTARADAVPLRSSVSATGRRDSGRAGASDAIGERSARLWTPDRVPLTVPLAGLGERALAYIVDVGVIVLLLLAGLFVYNTWGDLQADVGGMSSFGTLLLGVGLFSAAVLYDVLFEAVGDGRTPGKRLVGLRVLKRDGRTPDIFTASLRNLVRIFDFLPFGYAAGTVALFFTGTRRLGDIVADTFVVSERSRGRDPLALCRAAAGTEPIPAPRAWSDDNAMLALSIVERTHGLDAASAQALCARVLARVDPALPTLNARVTLALQCLALANAPAGALVDVRRVVTAESALAEAMARLPNGTAADALAADSALRRASSELMRATRRGLAARHLESLSLALLLAERQRVTRAPARSRVRDLLLAEVPSAVWSERKLIGRAAAVLLLGLLLGGAVSFADAEVARGLLGDDLARRVEEGASWTNKIEQDSSFAQTSVSIIINNVGVGLRVFVFGLLGGVATLLGLLSNGVQIGAVFGYALRLGTAGTLLRFIAAHGPVELTMVCVAGAAGLCLGRAIVSPGARTRAEALRAEGARGVRLVIAASLGFLCIGTVEGFVSPGQTFPIAVNIGLGLTLLAIFWTWVAVYGTAPRAANDSARGP
jgi:uncharacterized RDD family membrane protein YckC/uncharacterized membrane protein SpoIIM required for sporulation